MDTTLLYDCHIHRIMPLISEHLTYVLRFGNIFFSKEEELELMERAFVLINCDLGAEKQVIGELKNLKNIKEVHGILGSYDILATVESKTTEKVRQTVIGQIRNLDHIRSTLTLMGVEDVEPNMMKAELIPDIIPEEKKPLERPRGMDEEEFDEEYDDEE